MSRPCYGSVAVPGNAGLQPSLRRLGNDADRRQPGQSALGAENPNLHILEADGTTRSLGQLGRANRTSKTPPLAYRLVTPKLPRSLRQYYRGFADKSS